MIDHLGYGLTSKHQAVFIARKICWVLGGGSNGTATKQMIETAQQETRLGSFKDKYPYKHGVGLCQIDPIGFQDVQERIRAHVSKKVLDNFDIKIRHVQHRELAYSPFLSLLFCRLFYMRILTPIPKTVQLRADYWKKYYNSAKGRGLAAEYIAAAKEIKVEY